MPTLHLVSLGCTKNLVDSEVMLGRLRHYDIVHESSEADVIIVNTCGFIEAAKTESINTILELHDSRKEDSLLIMTGCLTERYQEELQNELPEVDLFTGLGDFAKIDTIIAKKESRFTQEVFLIGSEERIITGSQRHAYVKISEGCNQQCSFCAIPSFKGKLHSRDLSSILDEIKRLGDSGYDDISLISQDTSSYLRDQGEKEGLIQLIESLEPLETIRHARILYLYPSTTSHKLIETIGHSSKMHNYFDMPIQHISDRMLKTMLRGINKENHIDLLSRMRALPESFLRTSFIVGHPGESEQDFHEMCEYIKSFPFDRINLFAYSDEEETKAFGMEDKIPEEVIGERLSILEEITDKAHEASLQKEVGNEVEVYLEGESDEHEYLLSARKTLWAPDIDGEILINESEVEDTEFDCYYTAKVTERQGKHLLGTLIQKHD